MSPLLRTNIEDINLALERLEQVSRVITELPEEKEFSLNIWGRRGTVADATGWCSFDSWFNEQGFMHISTGGTHTIPIYLEHKGWDAIREFFKLDLNPSRYKRNTSHYKECFYIFQGKAYKPKEPTKTDVINRIHTFCTKLENQIAILEVGN